MEQLQGVVERITYSDEEKGFSVLKIRSKGYGELITIIGNMAHLNVGTVVTAAGKWSINPKFGKQFNVLSWEETLPASIYGIEKYLGSGLIKGIGPKYAKLIVKTFESETLDIIENEPSRLIEVPNIGHKRVNLISKAWVEQKDIKNLMIFLQELGVSTAFGYRIYKVYGKEGIEKIKENPYGLADEVYGIGFKTADFIAGKLGVDKESYNRCRAGILYILNYFADNDGHCYVPKDEVVKKCVEILEIEDVKIIMTYDYLVKNNEIILEDNEKMYLPAFYYSEVGLAKRIKDIINFSQFETFSDEKLKSEIQGLEKKNDIKYDSFQINAIKLAVKSKFSVITGGAGVGKTTITKAIIEIFKNQGKKIILTAPTGRAAKRMTETCGMESKTIHRLLDYKPKSGFNKNAENKLQADVLIVDEASMIDLILMYSLLKAVHDNIKIILIGDINQLPSVGAGNVLKDIIESGVIPVIKLTKIYRQALTSNIIINSHKINNGEMPILKSDFKSDFFFIEKENPDEIVNLISELCSKRLPNYYKVDPISDIQVLIPTRRGQLGTDNLNKTLQSALNKNTLCLRRGANEYRKGDKVMQIKNNYDKDIYNGDIGIISNVNLIDKNLTVNFDEKYVDYDILELEELTLSYSCTIHKSQGGEYLIVVMSLTFGHYIMLERNLLYTGVTRAKKVCIIIGEKRAVKYAVGNNVSHKRYTLLAERLK